MKPLPLSRLADEIDFRPTPWTGVRMAVLVEARPVGRWLLVDMAAGARLPPHQHEGEEWILLLAGRLMLGAEMLLPQQSRRIAAGCLHAPAAPERALYLVCQQQPGGQAVDCGPRASPPSCGFQPIFP